jgi:tape measure domain-containing protein
VAGTLSTLLVKIQGDASGLRKELGSVEQSAQRSGGILQSALGTGLGFIGASVAMKGLGAAANFAGDMLIGYNARMEQAQIGFTTLLGSASKATAFIKDLQHFAAVTPFDFPGLQKSANLMLAMGFNAKDVIPDLTAVGDAVAALGGTSENVDMVVRALGQMKLSGRVNAQDMMQLTSQGINGWKLLADQMGISTAEVRKLSEKGLIPADKAIQTIITGIEKGNMAGAMAKQATTFTGAMSTIIDTISQLTSTALAPLFIEISKVVVAFSQWVQTPGAATFFKTIGDGIGRLVGFIGSLFSGFQQVIGVFSSGETAVSGLGNTLGALGETLTNLRETVLNAVLGAFQTLLSALPDALNQLAALVPPALTTITGAIISWATTAADQFMTFISKAVDILMANLPAILTAISGFFQAAFDWILNVGVPMAANAIGPLALKFVDWVGQMLPKLAAALPPIAGTILAFIAQNLPVLGGKLLEWAGAFIGWIATNVVPRLPGALAAIAGALFGWLATTASSLIAKAGQMGQGFVTGLMDWLSKLPGNLLTLFGQMISAIAGFAPKMAQSFAGLAIGAGKAFANGIVGLLEGAINAIIHGLNSFQIHFAGLDLGPLGHVAAVDWNGFGLGEVHLPRFEKGLWNAGGKSFMGMLDPGEMVLPKAQAEQLRGFLSGNPRTGSASVDGFGDSGRTSGKLMEVNLYIDKFIGDDTSAAQALSDLIGSQVRLALKG